MGKCSEIFLEYFRPITIHFEFEEAHVSNNSMNGLSLLWNGRPTSLKYVPEASSKIRTIPLSQYWNNRALSYVESSLIRILDLFSSRVSLEIKYKVGGLADCVLATMNCSSTFRISKLRNSQAISFNKLASFPFSRLSFVPSCAHERGRSKLPRICFRMRLERTWQKHVPPCGPVKQVRFSALIDEEPMMLNMVI